MVEMKVFHEHVRQTLEALGGESVGEVYAGEQPQEEMDRVRKIRRQ